jgi:hypothetical protein
VIKVENQTAGTGTLHTKESAHQQALASRVKVEHAPTTPATPTAPTSHTKTTKFALLGNRHLGMLTEEPDVGQGNGPFPLLGSGNGPCPTGKVRDYAGYCFNAREAKACFTCPPGSTLAGQQLEHAHGIELARQQALASHVKSPTTPTKTPFQGFSAERIKTLSERKQLLEKCHAEGTALTATNWLINCMRHLNLNESKR